MSSWWAHLSWSDVTAIAVSALAILACTYVAWCDRQARRRERAEDDVRELLARGRCSHGVQWRSKCPECAADLVRFLGGA